MFLEVSQNSPENICARNSFVFWILRNFLEHLFLQSTSRCCFCFLKITNATAPIETGNNCSIEIRQSQNPLEVFLGVLSCFATLLKSHIGIWVFSCKFAAHFQNTSTQEHLWRVASAGSPFQIHPMVDALYETSSFTFNFWVTWTPR